jgi:hypothetical protein
MEDGVVGTRLERLLREGIDRRVGGEQTNPIVHAGKVGRRMLMVDAIDGPTVVQKVFGEV